MSKPIKDMITADYSRRFDGVENACLVDIRGIDANDNNELRVGLHGKEIRVTVVKNSLAKSAFKDGPLEALQSLLDGPCAVAYGADSVVEVARELVVWARKVKKLDLKGAVLDGELFEGAAGVKRLADFPTREEAQAKVVQLVLSPAGNIVSAAKSGGSNLLAIVKEIEERLEKGEAISKV